MADLILHHYDSSPFSEKIRLALACKRLPWVGVKVPATMPKPDVVALTGGYRRTPFLQVGADIYCDSALICDVLEHLRPQPPLYPPGLKGVARIFAQWADNQLFWAAMAYNLQPMGADWLFAGAGGPDVARAFVEDRKAMSGNMARLRPADATSAYRSYLRRLSHMTDEHPFLFGNEPCVADFAAYHPLWFTRTQVPPLAGILAATPSVLEWMDRMAGQGSTCVGWLEPADALAIAAAAEPAPPGQHLLLDSTFQDDHGIPLGTRVTITAESFGPEPTYGELLAATRTHYTLRRVDDRVGEVHVHFPRIGYVLRKAAGS